MLNVLGENYYIDLDEIEKYLDIPDLAKSTESLENSETKINIVKFEMVKLLLETILSETTEIDEKLGMKKNTNHSVPFRIAFNSLLNKKIINYY